MKYDGILFDLDGTLWDATEAIRVSWAMALESVLRPREYAARPDFIEILPGTMPKIFRRVCGEIQTPVIAGGLISDKEDIMAALGSGACAISTTNPQVWFM